MRKPTLGVGSLALPLSFVLAAFGCDDGGDSGEGAEEVGTETEGEGEGEDTETTGDEGPADSDQDGLTDEEEAMIGTDPLKKDTDADNYWDSWEVTEGTDPLDVESRIYTGYWPYNPDKDLLEQGSWATASKVVGKPIPRAEFLDHHGDMVDIYDFSNFTAPTQDTPAFMIVDLSAQWCGPCHNVANWISGVDDANTSWIQTAYPTVRDKVHGLRIWWLTFIVEDVNGGPPTAADATTWFGQHHDNYIPILVDAEQQMWPKFGGSGYPHFFLIDPEMRIEYFPGGADATDANPYPAVGLVDQYL
jgi:hypothetical protein